MRVAPAPFLFFFQDASWEDARRRKVGCAVFWLLRTFVQRGGSFCSAGFVAFCCENPEAPKKNFTIKTPELVLVFYLSHADLI